MIDVEDTPLEPHNPPTESDLLKGRIVQLEDWIKVLVHAIDNLYTCGAIQAVKGIRWESVKLSEGDWARIPKRE